VVGGARLVRRAGARRSPLAARRAARSRYRRSRSATTINTWGAVSGEVFKLRGGNYLKDKVKIPSPPALYDALGMDCVRTPLPVRRPSSSSSYPCRAIRSHRPPPSFAPPAARSRRRV